MADHKVEQSVVPVKQASAEVQSLSDDLSELRVDNVNRRYAGMVSKVETSETQ